MTDTTANSGSAAVSDEPERPQATDGTRMLEQLILLASRSPSPHNTQPWSPQIVEDPARAGAGADPDSHAGAGAPTVEVCVVPSRTLPAGDPSFRDIVLSLGAWVESFAIGAAELGFDVDVEALDQLSRLEELPLIGPADRSKPVLRVRLVQARGDGRSPARPHPFTADDVRDRAVYRGRLVGHPATWDDLRDVDLPPWLSLRRLDDRAMAYLSRLGIAFTASRPSIANELLHWLRLDPAHPRYARDGMTDVMLGVPAPFARLAAPATRYPGIRDPLVRVAGAVGRAAESLERARTLRPLALSLAESSTESPTHLVLVANARLAALDDGPRTTAAMDSRIGVSEPDALEAGRILQRLWLHAHTRGLVVSPHSELIDSPLAHGLLRKRLSLGRADVALSVFSAGVAAGELPRSPRLTDARARAGAARLASAAADARPASDADARPASTARTPHP